MDFNRFNLLCSSQVARWSVNLGIRFALFSEKEFWQKSSRRQAIFDILDRISNFRAEIFLKRRLANQRQRQFPKNAMTPGSVFVGDWIH